MLRAFRRPIAISCSQTARSRRNSRLFRPALEILEDRLAPATIRVTGLGDAVATMLVDNGGGNYDAANLRSAVVGANGMAGADTIVFQAGLTGTITLTIAGDNSLGRSALLASSQITINGNNGAAGITVTQNVLPVLGVPPGMRLFLVNGTGNLTLQGITLSGGRAQGGNGGGTFAAATSRGGGGGAAGMGGGVFVDNGGRLTIERSTLTGNVAEGGAGGVGVFIAGATGYPGGGGGGGLASDGFEGAVGPSHAGGNGGGPNPGTGGVTSGASGTNGGMGGGGGGGIGSTGVAGSGGRGGNGGFGGGGGSRGARAGNAGAPTSLGGFGGGGGFNGYASGSGYGGFGGGSSIGASTGNGYGGGGAGMGGAIFSNGGIVTITNSTLSGNLARGGANGDGSAGSQGLGGGVFNHNGTLTINNSTIANNLARDSANVDIVSGGRGVFNLGDARPLAVRGGTTGTTATATINNTIIGQNGAPTTIQDFTGMSLAGGGNATGGSSNLIRVAFSFGGSSSNLDPLLGGLGFNGGPTRTHAVTAGPAINNGNNGVIPGGVISDQRGFQRIVGANVDIGAYEFNGNPVTDLAISSLTDAPDPVDAGANITYTINFANNGPSNAQTVTVTDATPANTTFVSVVTPAGWTATTPAVGSTGNVVFSKPTVAPGESATFQIVVKVNSNTSSGTINDTATAASATIDPVPANNSASTTTTVQVRADLEVVSNLDGPDPVTAGTNLTYTVLARNNGSSDAAGTVTVSVPLDANTTFVSASTVTGWTATTPPMGSTGTVTYTRTGWTAGSSDTFTITVAVPSSVANGTNLSSTATISCPTTTDPDSTNNSKTATTSVQASADLEVVSHSDSPDPVTAGTNLTYTVVARNNGASDAAGTVTVSIPLDASTTFVSASVVAGWTEVTPAVGSTGTVTYTRTGWTAGSSDTFTITVAVPSSVANGTNLSSTATISCPTTTDPNSANNSQTATTPVQASADLEVVSNIDSPDPVTAGTNLTYTVLARNNGASDAAGTVTVSIPLDANTTFVSASVVAGWSATTPAVGSTGTVTYTRTGWTAGSSDTFTITVAVRSNVANGTTLSSTASISCPTTTDPTPGNNSRTATTTVQAQADLELVSDTAPPLAAAGTNFSYTIVARNNGPSDAAGTVTLSVPLDANTTFVSVVTPAGWSATTPAVGSTGTVTFTRTGWVAGASDTFTITVAIPPGVPSGTVLSSTSTISCPTTLDPTPGNNSQTATTTVSSLADVAVSLSGPGTAAAGTDVTYSISVTNNGPSSALNVTLTDNLPPGMTFVSQSQTSGPAFTLSNSATGINNSIVSLAPGATATFSLTVRIGSGVAAGTTLTNTATVSTTSPDPTPGNNSASVTTTVNTLADLSLTLTASPNPVVAGTTLTFVYTITNTGPSDATNVTLAGLLPAASQFNVFSVTASQGTASASGTTLSAALGTLARGASATVTVVGQPTKVGTVTASGTVTSNQPEPATANNSATVTLTVVQAPAIFATGADAGGLPQVNVYDARNNAPITSFHAFPGFFTGGVRVAVADVNNDGIPDVIAGAGPGALPQVSVFDGRTFQPIMMFHGMPSFFSGGVYVAGGDVNGDGFGDILVGAGAGAAPQVNVFSGKDGSLLLSHYAFPATFTGGVRVAAGDVDGDGRADLITGAGPGGLPQVTVFSGSTLKVLQNFFAFPGAFTGGVYVAGGDLNGDGRAEVIVGAGTGAAPQVSVFRDGAPLYSFFNPRYAGMPDVLGLTSPGIRVGTTVTGGRAEILTSTGPGVPALVDVFDGVSAAHLASFFAYDPSFRGGAFIS